MLKRDSHGIICQHSVLDPNYMDGGDSLRATGIMALCGSQDDKRLLPLFDEALGYLCRHPWQEEWKSVAKTSRDQVVCAVASGLPRSVKQYLEDGVVNKDFLDFGVRLYMYKTIGQKAPAWLRFLGTINLFLSLVWNTKIKPSSEMNQFACICIVMGPWWCDKLMTWHPDIFGNINEYWGATGGWRNQPEIGRALLSKLFTEATKA
jgi:hypothetical protein